jgi:outer membrane protein assembly factor BamB
VITRRTVLIATLAAFAAGCGASPPPVVPAGGRITINGKPLAKALVTFVPQTEFGPEYMSYGITDDDGKYSLTCANGTVGASACENKVLVAEPSPEGEMRGQSARAQDLLAKYMASLKNRPIPADYGTLARSPLVATVTAENSQYDFDLKR